MTKKLAETASSVLTALLLLALGVAMWWHPEVSWQVSAEAPAWAESILRRLWGPVAGSVALVVGGLMLWGSFLEPYELEPEEDP